MIKNEIPYSFIIISISIVYLFYFNERSINLLSRLIVWLANLLRTVSHKEYRPTGISNNYDYSTIK